MFKEEIPAIVSIAIFAAVFLSAFLYDLRRVRRFRSLSSPKIKQTASSRAKSPRDTRDIASSFE